MANLDSISLAFAFAPKEVLDKYRNSFNTAEAQAYADATIVGAQTAAADQLANLPPLPNLPAPNLPKPTTPTPTAAAPSIATPTPPVNPFGEYAGTQTPAYSPAEQQQQYANYADALSFIGGQVEQNLPGLPGIIPSQTTQRLDRQFLAGQPQSQPYGINPAVQFAASQPGGPLYEPSTSGPGDYVVRPGSITGDPSRTEEFAQRWNAGGPARQGVYSQMQPEAQQFFGGGQTPVASAVRSGASGALQGLETLKELGLQGMQLTSSPDRVALPGGNSYGGNRPELLKTDPFQDPLAYIREGSSRFRERPVWQQAIGEAFDPINYLPVAATKAGMRLPGLASLLTPLSSSPSAAVQAVTEIGQGAAFVLGSEAARSLVPEGAPGWIKTVAPYLGGLAAGGIYGTSISNTPSIARVVEEPSPEDIAKLQAETAARRQRFQEISGPSAGPITPSLEVTASRYGVTPDEYLGIGQHLRGDAEAARTTRPGDVDVLRRRQAGESSAAAERALSEGLPGSEIARARAEAMRGGIGGPTLDISDEAANAIYRNIELDRQAGNISAFEARQLDDYLRNARQGVRNDPSAIENFARWMGVQADAGTSVSGARRATRAAPEVSRTVAEDITPGGISRGKPDARAEVQAAIQQAQLPDTAALKRQAEALAEESTKLGHYADPAANVRRTADEALQRVNSKLDALYNPASAYKHPDGGGLLSEAQRNALIKAYTDQRDELVAIKASVSPEAIDRKIVQDLNERVALNPESRDNALALVSAWQDVQREVTDQIGETMHRRMGAALANATGRTSDSYATALVNQRENLYIALRNTGVDPKMADDIADAAVQRELLQRYPDGTPEGVAKAIDEARRTPQTAGQELVQGLGDWSQELKNLMFGLDLGVALQQGARAGVTGFVPLATGVINRIANAVHMGANLYDDGTLLSRSQQRTLAGLGTGRHTGIVDMADQQGTIIREFGRVGRTIDKPLSAGIKALTDFQFVKVLGTMRDLIYEGNLVLAKAAGADITSAAVRKTLAENANALTSYAPRAARAGRASAERAALLSPSMTRAQINRVSQMAKILKPGATTPERVVAATTILGTGLMYYAYGKVLNDLFGITDFVWDPTQPGAGLITLPDGTVWDVTPQDQLEKAIFQSIRYLSEADPQKAAEAWGKFAIGRGSPPVQAIGRATGVGYFEGEGYRFGGTRNPRSFKDSILDIAPIPPLATSAIRGELTPTSAIVGTLGGSNFPEGARGELARLERELGFDPYTNDPVERRRMQIDVRQNPELQALLEQSKIDYGGQSAQQVYAFREAADAQQKNDAALAEWRQNPRNGTTPQDWREERKRINERYRAQLDEIYRGSEDKPPEDPVDFYYQAIRDATVDNQVDWDEVDRFFASMTPEDQQLVNDWLGSGDTPTEAEYRQATKALDEAGWWDIRDEEARAWVTLAQQSGLLDIPIDLPEGFGYYDLTSALYNYAVDYYANEGQSSALASENARDFVRKMTTGKNGLPVTLSGSVSAARLDWIASHPEEAKLLVQWGFNPGSEDAEKLLQELGAFD